MHARDSEPAARGGRRTVVAPEPDLVSLALIFCAAALGTVVSQLSPRLVLPTVVVEIALGILMGPEVLDIANVDPSS